MPRKSARVRLAVVFVVMVFAGFAAGKFVSFAQKKASPSVGPSITATETLTDPASVGGSGDGKAQPGETLLATVTITNNGSDATGVSLNDSPGNFLSPNGVNGSSAIGPIAAADTYANAIPNVDIVADIASGVKANDLNPSGAGSLTITGFGDTLANANANPPGTPVVFVSIGTLNVNSDGSFTYDPPVGSSTQRQFFYTLGNGSGLTSVGTVTVSFQTTPIWFINNAGGACPAAPCDGRLTHPFISLATFQAANGGGAGKPAAGDDIFFAESGAGYMGPITLLNNQKFIGQDATSSLLTITGLTAPPGTNQLPGMTPGAGQVSTINAGTSGITLGQNNTLRGFSISGTTGAKISGASFGTLLVGDSASPDVSLSGGGQALSLTTGSFAATSGFGSVASTSSSSTGITLDNVSVAGGGTVSFADIGQTTAISGSTAEGILVKDCTAANSCVGTIAFGNTTVSGGTDGVSFTNNNAGTRSFGTLGVSGGSGSAFKNVKGALANGGGNVTVTGAATLSSAGSAVNVADMVASSSINFQSSVSATSTGSGNAGVSLSGANGAGATLTFNSLTVQTNAGTGLAASGGGTVTVTTGTGTINNTTQAASAIVANGVALNANFATVNSSGGTNGVSLTSVTGTSNFGTGALSGASGATFLVSAGTTSTTYSGNITQANNAAAVSISGGHSGTTTFQTGTISATNGTGLQFDNADGTYNFNGTNTLNGGDAGIDILNGSSGTFSFASTSTITSPSGAAFNVGTSPGNPTVTYSGSITQNTSGQRVINVDTTTGGSVTFNTGTITGGASSTGININAANGNVTFSNGMTLGTSGSRMTNQALTITGGTGTYGLGVVSIFTSGAQGMVATNADGTINSTGTVDASGDRAINISGPAGVTTLGMTLTKVNSTNSTTTGITLVNTGGTFSVIGDNTNTGQGGNGTGGTISGFTGADGTTVGNGTSNGLGIGVYMSNATGVSLRRMTITGPGASSNFAVEGETISGFTMQYCTVNGSNGDSAAQDEGSTRFLEPRGTDVIDNCDISGGFEDNVNIQSNSGTLTDFQITNNNIHDNSSTTGNQGILIDVENSPNVTYHITGNSFAHNRADSVDISGSGGAGSNTALIKAIIDNNHFNGERATDLGGGVQIETANFDGHLQYDISSNTFQPTVGNVGVIAGSDILIDSDTASATGVSSTLFEGQIANNTIGTSGVDHSATAEAVDAIFLQMHNQGTYTTKITGNTIQRYGAAAIEMQVGAVNLTTGTVNATITGNTIRQPSLRGDGGSNNGILGNFGTNTGNAETVNLDISGNTVGGAGSNQIIGAEDMRLRQRMATVVGLKNLGSNTTNDATVTSFLISQNNAVNTPTASATHTVGWNTISSVPQPTVPTIPARGVSTGIARMDLRPTVPLGMDNAEIALAEPVVNVLGDTAMAKVVTTEQRTSDRGQLPVVGGQSEDKPSLIAELYDKMTGSIEPTVEAQSVPTPGITTTPTFTLPAGSSVTITYQLTVTNGPYPAALNNVTDAASVSWTGTPAGNTAVSPAATILLDAAPSISVGNTDSTGEAQPGTTVTYAVSATNASIPNGQNATGVVLTATIPANSVFNAGSSAAGWNCPTPNTAGTTCTNTIGPLTADGTPVAKNFAVDVTGNLPATTTTIANAASVADDGTNGTNTLNPGTPNLTDTDNVRGLWEGTTNTDWFTATNWANNLPPTGGNVAVSTSAGSAPTITGNSATITKLFLNGKDLTISGGRTLTASSSVSLLGNKVLGAGTLELGQGATISRTTGQVNCALMKDFLNGAIAEGAEGITDTNAPDALAAVFTFPVGTASGFFPVDVTPTGGSTGSLTVQTFDGTAGVVPPLDNTKTLQRYWTLASTGSITADVKFSYEPGTTINGNEANYKPTRVTGGVATSFTDNCPSGTCVDQTNHFIFMPQISTFNGNWTASELAPTAARVGVSGRVLSADGRAIRGVRVTLDDGTGHAMTMITNAFGYYHFDEVQSGGTYLLNAIARGYTFTPQVVSVNDELTDVNMVALP